MFKTSRENKMVEVLTGAAQRRRRTPQEKVAIVQQSMGKRQLGAVCS